MSLLPVLNARSKKRELMLDAHAKKVREDTLNEVRDLLRKESESSHRENIWMEGYTSGLQFSTYLVDRYV